MPATVMQPIARSPRFAHCAPRCPHEATIDQANEIRKVSGARTVATTWRHIPAEGFLQLRSTAFGHILHDVFFSRHDLILGETSIGRGTNRSSPLYLLVPSLSVVSIADAMLATAKVMPYIEIIEKHKSFMRRFLTTQPELSSMGGCFEDSWVQHLIRGVPALGDQPGRRDGFLTQSANSHGTARSPTIHGDHAADRWKACKVSHPA